MGCVFRRHCPQELLLSRFQGESLDARPERLERCLLYPLLPLTLPQVLLLQ